MRNTLKTVFRHLWFAPLALLALMLPPAAWAGPGNGIKCLQQAYPSFFVGIEGQDLLLADGSRLSYGSGTTGDFETRLNHADLHDQMSQCYPAGYPLKGPVLNQDPGRLRHEAFFLRLYGDNQNAVRKNMRPVVWTPSGKTVQFTSVGGADLALARVAKAIMAKPELAPLVAALAGTFNWRPMAGTSRMSSHSFAAAIDFQLPKNIGSFWQWAGCRPGTACNYPEAVLRHRGLREVVRIFEANGFIWGGKWHHFDTIHFEYRPELLVPECSC